MISLPLYRFMSIEYYESIFWGLHKERKFSRFSFLLLQQDRKMCFKFHLQLAVIGIAVFVTGICCQLPCDSPLRLRRPEFFKHCDCSYGDWSEWEIVAGSRIDVPKSQCEKGEAYSESRQKKSFGKNCPPITETRLICKLLKTEYIS